MKNIIKIFFIFLLLSCTQTTQAENTLVLEYSDFGPPAMANEVIGMDWWQWQPHGDSRPKKHDIKVVVYRDISLEKIKISYPVIPPKKQDYRYIEYQAALDYLNQGIVADAVPALTKQLEKTKKIIVLKLGAK